MYYQKYAQNINILWLFRTMFALAFVHLGYLYRTHVEGNINIFSSKALYSVLIIQALLWLTNQDYSAVDGIGLHFLLVWGQYNNCIVPIFTAITGIWVSLFIIEITYDKICDWKFLHKIGKNSYHIMANHLLVFNFLTYVILAIKGIPFDIKNYAVILIGRAHV